MKINNPMLVVADMDKSVEFSKNTWVPCNYGFWSK